MDHWTRAEIYARAIDLIKTDGWQRLGGWDPDDGDGWCLEGALIQAMDQMHLLVAPFSSARFVFLRSSFYRTEIYTELQGMIDFGPVRRKLLKLVDEEACVVNKQLYAWNDTRLPVLGRFAVLRLLAKAERKHRRAHAAELAERDRQQVLARKQRLIQRERERKQNQAVAPPVPVNEEAPSGASSPVLFSC
jgi:hypothetical protein